MAEALESPNFTGTWKFESGDANFEDFLKASGTPWMLRKVVAKISPTLKFEQEENHFKVTTTTVLITRTTEFTVGVDFETTRPENGAKLKVKSRWDGNRLIMEYISLEPDKANDSSIIREIIDDKLVQRLSAGDVTTNRYFRRQK